MALPTCLLHPPDLTLMRLLARMRWVSQSQLPKFTMPPRHSWVWGLKRCCILEMTLLPMHWVLKKPVYKRYGSTQKDINGYINRHNLGQCVTLLRWLSTCRSERLVYRGLRVLNHCWWLAENRVLLKRLKPQRTFAEVTKQDILNFRVVDLSAHQITIKVIALKKFKTLWDLLNGCI